MNYLPYLTLKRIFNLFKIGCSYILSFILKKDIHFGLPYAISIEISAICNLKCPQCVVGRQELKRQHPLMKMEAYKHILNKLPEEIFYINLYFQGEPLLNPEIYEMILLAKRKHCYVIISTNASLLTENCCIKLINCGLDKIIVSIDGSNQRIYEKYRSGGNLQKVLIGIETLQRLKQETKKRLPKLEIQAIVFKTNEYDLENIRQIAINHHAESIVFKTAQIYDMEKYEELLPENSIYARYKKDKNGNYIIKSQNHSACFRLWTSNVITSDGEYLPCCYDKNGNYSFGNIFENTYKQLIHNEKSKKFRAQVCNNRKSIYICKNCF